MTSDPTHPVRERAPGQVRRRRRLVPLAPGRERAAAEVLAAAFWDDPVMMHLLPTDSTRHRRLSRLFRWTIVDARRRGLVHVTDDLTAATIWHAPGQHRTTPGDAARALPSMLRVFPPDRLAVAGAALSALEAHHPHEPHWYLSVIGSHPAHRGVGAGRTLLEPVLALADEEGLGAYLESSKAENVPYYERFGFGVTEELSLPGGGPTLHLMWRDPRPT